MQPSLLFSPESVHSVPWKSGSVSPDRCGSVGWVSSYKVKGRQFDSCSGHMPGLQVQSLVRAHRSSNQSINLDTEKCERITCRQASVGLFLVVEFWLKQGIRKLEVKLCSSSCTRAREHPCAVWQSRYVDSFWWTLKGLTRALVEGGSLCSLTPTSCSGWLENSRRLCYQAFWASGVAWKAQTFPYCIIMSPCYLFTITILFYFFKGFICLLIESGERRER